ncbi:hypothetical protein AB0A73_04655 [Glycomyces sp. NPDC047369]
MLLEDLRAWLPDWCRRQLGSEPVAVMFGMRRISSDPADPGPRPAIGILDDRARRAITTRNHTAATRSEPEPTNASAAPKPERVDGCAWGRGSRPWRIGVAWALIGT